MLDIKLIRENPDLVRKNLEQRGDPEKLRLLDDLIRLYKKWRQLLTKANELRHERKKITEEIAKLKHEGKDATQKLKQAQHFP